MNEVQSETRKKLQQASDAELSKEFENLYKRNCS